MPENPLYEPIVNHDNPFYCYNTICNHREIPANVDCWLRLSPVTVVICDQCHTIEMNN